MPENYKGPVLAPVAELKKIVLVKRPHRSLTYQLDGTIDVVIQRLIELKESTPEGCSLELNFEKVYGCWGDDDTWEVALYDRRIETDQECRIRIQQERQQQINVRAHKMAQLEQLKKELGEE